MVMRRAKGVPRSLGEVGLLKNGTEVGFRSLRVAQRFGRQAPLNGSKFGFFNPCPSVGTVVGYCQGLTTEGTEITEEGTMRKGKHRASYWPQVEPRTPWCP